MFIPRLVKIIGLLLLLVKPLPASVWSEAQAAAAGGDYGAAVRLLTRAVDAGAVSPGEVALFETQAFLWRRELGEGREGLTRLLELPSRTAGGLDAAASALGDYWAETPTELHLWFEAVDRLPAWSQESGTLAKRLLERNAPEAAAKVAGADPARCRSVLGDLARHPALAELALASYGGDPHRLDLGTWRVWLRLIESARGAEAAAAESLARLEREPGRVEFRVEASERLRGMGRAEEALRLWEGQDGSLDDRVHLERGECLFALGRVEEALASWRAKLERANLRPGDVRTVARIFSDHGLVSEALFLLENPPVGGFGDYARDIARLLFSLGRFAEAARVCAETAALEGLGSWSLDFIKGFGHSPESATAALGVLQNREEPMFGRLRLYLALEPWALSSIEEGPGPLPHPWREPERRLELDERARRVVEDEIRRLEGFFTRHPDALDRLSRTGGLLPLEAVDLLGRSGLPREALAAALAFASLETMGAKARSMVAVTGLSYASAAGLDARGVETAAILALNPGERELAWRTALFLLRGDRAGEAAALLEELAAGRGFIPREDELLAARLEAAVVTGEKDRAWDLAGASPDELQEPVNPELHYWFTVLQLIHLRDALEGDRAFDAAPVMERVRHFIARRGEDPRATDLLRLLLAHGLIEEELDKEAFAELVRAYLAGLWGDERTVERSLERALAAGGPLATEAAVQRADLHAERGEYAAARSLLDGVIAAAVEGTSDRALALAAWLDADFLGEKESAVEGLAALLTRYPGSVLLEYARRGLAALKE